MSLIGFILFGLVIGFLAKLLMPGREPTGFVVTALLGMAGSVLGALLGRAIGADAPGQMTAGWIPSIVGALLLLGIYHLLTRNRAVAPV